MKRILLLATVGILLVSVAAVVPFAQFNWGRTSHNFGRITVNKPVVAEFSFTNNGELPLLISKAKGSCGCTGVEYPKAAVLPGGSGVIKATFNAAVVGAFSKTITVESNAAGGTETLVFTGEVVKDAGSPL